MKTDAVSSVMQWDI